MPKMSSTDSRSQGLPYKLQVATPECRGGCSQNRGGYRNSGPDQAFRGGDKRGNFERNGNDNRSQNSYRGGGNRSFRSEQNMSGRGRSRSSFDKSPSVKRPKVVSRSVSRDSLRCFYCKEPGHIAKFCLRRQEDENRLKRG